MLFKTILKNKTFVINQVKRTSATEISFSTVKNPIIFQKGVEEITKAHYKDRNRVTLIPGSGIGPELLNYVTKIISFSHAPIDFEVVDIKTGEDLDLAITSIRRNGVAIKGNMHSIDEETTPPNVALRQNLDLYVSLLHCKTIPFVPCKQHNVDCVIIRQNTEGEYSMLEHESVPGVVESLKVITRENTERLAMWACEYALKHNRKKITVIHKANILKLSDGLFRDTAYKVASRYPKLKFDEMIIDAFSAKAVNDASYFDVLLMPNLYGTIAGNIMCGLLGGPGLIAGRNYGDRYAIFELGTRNTGSNIAGKDVANPVSMLMAAVEVLYHLGHNHFAELIKKATLKTLEDKEFHTADLGGDARSSEVIDRIVWHIDNIEKTEAIRFYPRL